MSRERCACASRRLKNWRCALYTTSQRGRYFSVFTRPCLRSIQIFRFEIRADSLNRRSIGNGLNQTVNGTTNGVHHEEWTPSSWRTRPIKQPVVYEDQAAVDNSITKLRRLPPLVTPVEIQKLRKSLEDVALGTYGGRQKASQFLI